MESNRAMAGWPAKASSLIGTARMQMDPCQWFAIMPKALKLALFPIADGFCGAKKRDSYGLRLFRCVAIVTRAILSVYRENNLGHGSPRLQQNVKATSPQALACIDLLDAVDRILVR
jgi:hypothetical protein